MYIELSVDEVARYLDQYGVMGGCDSSFQACYALAEYLEELEECTGESIKLDPIALRCEWDYQTLEYIREQYFQDSIDDDSDDSSIDDQTLELLEEHTQCRHVQNDEYIYIQF